jgi:2-iminobutanoate/2-iminopropanoate deaminase
MNKTAIRTDSAPAAAGPYSQAIVANGFVFAAGQVAYLPGTRTLAEGGIQGQTRQALNNIKAVLEAAGTSMDKVVKTTVFLSDINNFAAMNEVYATFFGDTPPARSTVQVVLPLGALIEIEAIAML